METGPIIRLMQSSEASPKFLRNRIRIQDSAMRMDEHQNSPATTTTTKQMHLLCMQRCAAKRAC